MSENLITRPEACSLFGMSRSTFHTYSRHYPDFPAVKGVKKRHFQYARVDLITFFEAHAPQYAANAQKSAEVTV